MFQKLNKSFSILCFIFLLALFLRIWKLDNFPVGFHVDEVKVGWNALSILKTGADDHGNKFALYYNSFGDFRPTGIFYITIPFLMLFGRNEFAVRFPSALLGALTIFPLFFVVREIIKKSELKIWKWNLEIGHLASLMLTISPWHIAVSRATSEVAIAMFLTLSGLYFFLNYLNSFKNKQLIMSLLFLCSSYFFYHSVRILVPLFVGAIVVYYWKTKVNIRKFSILAFIILSSFTFILSLNKDARGRFSQVSIFNDLDVQYELTRMPFEDGPNNIFIARAFHNKISTYTRRFINEYISYFSADFLIGKEGRPARYATVGMGVLMYVELGLFVTGLIALAQKRYSLLPLFLLLLAPIPAALTTEDAPNLHRAFFMVPFIAIISSYGVAFLQEKNKRLLPVVYVLVVLNLIFFLHMYFVHNRVHLPLSRNVGAKELALYLGKLQHDYDKVIVTNIPDDPYPWIAFFTGKDPISFNEDAKKRVLGIWTSDNMIFSSQRCPSRDAFTNLDVKRLLVIDAEGCATESKLKDNPDVKILSTIKRPDDSEVYVVWSTNN